MDRGPISDAEARVLPSVCPLDCPDRCSLDVVVEGGRVTAIGGSRSNPLTQGFICSKVARFARRLYGPDRVLTPLRRAGAKGSGKFVRISWQDAADEIAARLPALCGEYGGECVLPFYYGGSNGLLTQGLMDAFFFRRLGSSRLARTVCAASTTLAGRAIYGKMPGVAFEDFARAQFILIWGANPRRSNIHLIPYLKEAKRRGARIAVVDPRRILGDELVDIHLSVYPGSDVAVALAMIRHLVHGGLAAVPFLEQHATGWKELFEWAEGFTLERAARCAGIAPGEIGALADAYAGSDPAVVRCGWGLERNRNGLASVAAVLALPAVAGKFGKPGGGFTLSNSGAYRTDDDRLAGTGEPATRTLNMNRLGSLLTGEPDPPVKALFIYNANPAVTIPDTNGVLRGLQREDLFTVVLEQVMTDSARFADIVLPATTFLEHRELNKSYGCYALQLAGPVVPPEGESKSNAEIFQLLGRALGWTEEILGFDDRQLLAHAVGSVGASLETDLTPAVLEARKILHFDFPGRQPVQFGSAFPGTSDRKVHLWPDELGERPYLFLDAPEAPDYPLALISPSSHLTISSTLGECNRQEVRLEMHPADAGQRGISDGDAVRTFNDRGELHCRVRLEPNLKPGVAALPKGFWPRAALNGASGNVLVADSLTPVSGGACFNDARVQVERLAEKGSGGS